MKKLLKELRNSINREKVMQIFVAIMVMATMSVSAFAAETSYTSMGTALVSGVGDMVNETILSVVGILPAVLPLMGISILVAYTVKFIKKIAK